MHTVQSEMKDQAKGILDSIDFHKWVYEAGEPPKKFDDNLVTEMDSSYWVLGEWSSILYAYEYLV